MSTVALQTFAAPIMDLLERDGVSELSINRPGEVWLEVGDRMERHEVPRLTLDHLKQLARLAAQYTEQLISEEHPLLSGTLPGGFRIQVVYPPRGGAEHDRALHPPADASRHVARRLGGELVAPAFAWRRVPKPRR